MFAAPVKDLTLARYLSAMEVDFIGIDIDEMDPQNIQHFINQIKDWIEGPKLIGVCKSEFLLKEYQTVFDGFYLQSVSIQPQVSLLFLNTDAIRNNPLLISNYFIAEDIADCSTLDNCILKTGIDDNPIANDKLTGYLFDPGQETQTGIFDFDKLDSWLEKLRQFRG